MAQRVAGAANALQLEPLLGRSIFALSGGEKQKIAFASVYAMHPDIYLRDEPFSNLDTASIAKLREHLRLVKAQGKTVIVAEHRLHFLMGVADRILYLQNGRIEGDFTPAQFRTLPTETRQRMGLRALSLSEERPAGDTSPTAEPVLEMQAVALSYQNRPVCRMSP